MGYRLLCRRRLDSARLDHALRAARRRSRRSELRYHAEVPEQAVQSSRPQGVYDFVAFLTPASLFVAYTTQSKFSHPVAVPNLPTLDGVSVNLQMWWFSAGATPQFRASNGLYCVLGRPGPG